MPTGDNLSRFFGRCSVVLANLQPESTAPPVGGSGDPFRDAAVQLVVGVCLLLALMFAVYLVYKYLLPKSGNAFKKSKNMKVLEITSVGPGTTVQIIKVSEEYFLIGVTRSQITFLAKLEEAALGGPEPGAEALAVPFAKYLDRFKRRKDQAGDGNDKTGE